MSQFLVPILTLTGLGLFFGLVLTLAAKKFSVSHDPRIQELIEKLPGANCGACGLAGCAGFAEALVKGEAVLANCKACSEEQAQQVAKVLGVKISATKKKIATLRCHGGKRAKDRFVYEGIKDCLAAAQLLGGQKSCSFACLGFGNCERVCPFGAIKMTEEGLPVIDSNLCTACGKCVPACPRNLLVLIADEARVYVACDSRDSAKIVARVCEVGCIACKKCEKICPEKAIKIVENLAIIDYDKCTSCGKCIEVCPRKIIKKRK